VVRGAEGVRLVERILGRQLERGVVVEQVGLVGVDVPLGRAGYLRRQAGAGEGVVEVAGLAVEDVGVGEGAKELEDQVAVVVTGAEGVIGAGQDLADRVFLGETALARVAERRPNLILLDLMMPRMDGFALISALRSTTLWRSIPIVVLTAIDLTAADRLRLNGYVEQVLQKGAYNHEELLSDVRDLVLGFVQRRAAR